MRLTLLLLAVLSAASLLAFRADDGGGEGPVIPEAIFEVTGGGALFHLEGGANPGNKAFKTKMNKNGIADCVDGDDFSCGGFFDKGEQSAEGKVYLYVYDATTWGLTTDPDPATALVTTLRGLMDGKGRFMFTGRHEGSGTDFVAEGKAALEKGTLTPKKVGGKIRAVSIVTEHWSVANFKTVASVPITN